MRRQRAKAVIGWLALSACPLLAAAGPASQDPDPKDALPRLALMTGLLALLGIAAVGTLWLWIAVRRARSRRMQRPGPRPTNMHPERDAWAESARRTLPDPPPRPSKWRKSDDPEQPDDPENPDDTEGDR